MNKDKDLKGLVTKHFDQQVYTLNEDKHLEKHGSLSNSPYLSSPYVFIEDNYLNDVSHKKILDYCCGTGLYSIFPATKGAKVFGVDISEQSILIAKSRAEKLNLSDRCDFKKSLYCSFDTYDTK